MSDRIYYTDPYCRTFRAAVTSSFEYDGRPAVTLDRTAFYPTSGGQPFDDGSLGGVQVIETVDGESVIHILSSSLPVGAAVEGEINWSRRFDHMQQHTGQHLLSAVFDRQFGNPTMSFHMGSVASTIDLAREVSAADIERAVDAANDLVWADLPVSIRFVTAEEAAALPLRKEPAREGMLRLIEIGSVDLSACGGTHVGRTGAVGCIAALASERHRGGVRLSFVCGGRTLGALRRYRDAVAASVRALSVLPDELPAAIERIQSEAGELRKEAKDLRVRLATHEGRRLTSEAALVGGVRVVVHSTADWDQAGLKAVAAAAAAAERAVVVLVTDSAPVSLVIASSPGVPVDARVLMRELIEKFGGRGGGKPDLAQGGGLNGPPEEIASLARELIEAMVREMS